MILFIKGSVITSVIGSIHNKVLTWPDVFTNPYIYYTDETPPHDVRSGWGVNPKGMFGHVVGLRSKRFYKRMVNLKG